MRNSSYDYRILVVDDENDVREFLSYNLEREGYRVATASDGLEAVAVTTRWKPHLIIMDVMMPVMDGIEACSEIRASEGPSGPLICFLTARGEDYSQIAGFEAGGDDYIVKPVRPKVLLQRVKALLKRYYPSRVPEGGVDSGLTVGGIILDREKYTVSVEGSDHVIPRKEFELLALLMSKPGKVFTREEIYSQVWGNDVVVGERTIDVHIRKLRERIGDRYIQTLKGVGYKFRELT